MILRVLKGSVAVLASVAIAFGAVGCSGKPSKDAVKEGIVKMMKAHGESSYDDETLNDYVGCIVDGSYDKLSADSLQKLADGKTGVTTATDEDSSTDAGSKISDDDGKAMGEAAIECGAKLAGKES
ncbi:hypothetical protein [[Pseudopropionibacterium] massiliense]|uniref:hypothetical protein n=1 Tax=[Pseudopropionibacterium] massiliense TaxID=2220000 RepID=UPI00102F4CEA|nr:hypothetical protein [[Pseudopropionibacterium] massiliense]